MQIPIRAADEFEIWVDQLEVDHSATSFDLGDKLLMWLADEGFDDVLGSYEVFLQTVLVLLARLNERGNYLTVRDAETRNRKPLLAGRDDRLATRYLTEEMFRDVKYQRETRTRTA